MLGRKKENTVKLLSMKAKPLQTSTCPNSVFQPQDNSDRACAETVAPNLVLQILVKANKCAETAPILDQQILAGKTA